MRKLHLGVLIAVLGALALPSWAGETIKVGRWSEATQKYVYSVAKLHTRMGKQGRTTVVADNIWGVVLPPGTEHLTLDRVDCFGDAPEFGGPAHNCMGWVSSRGELRIRATVRYGWFDGFDNYGDGKPILEIFVHVDSSALLPRMTGWTPGEIHEFRVHNERFVLAQLFDSQHLEQIRSKKRLFVEVDSNLLLSNIDFGNECGIRYQAKVLNAVPWTDAKVVAKTQGWEPHC